MVNVMKNSLQAERYEKSREDASANASTIPPDEQDAPIPDGAANEEGGRLWRQDRGTLPHDARAALLQLVRGPYISEEHDEKLWRALIDHLPQIEARLADLFLELSIDTEAGVAFAQNARAEDCELPKAARTYTLTYLDTIMLLILRRELLTNGAERAFISQSELFESLAQYRSLEGQDEAAYAKRLKSSWNRMADFRILIKSETEDRYEISPVLKLIFGSDEVEAINAAFEELLEGGATEPREDVKAEHDGRE